MAVPVNLLEAIAVDSVIPLYIVANPDMAVPGVNCSADTIPTTASLVMNFKMLLFTPTSSATTCADACVTPDPATVVGPISVHAVLLYT